MSDVQGLAENKSGSSQATFKAPGQEPQPDAPLRPGSFQADVEGLESFDDGPLQVSPSPRQPVAPPVLDRPEKPRQAKPSPAKAAKKASARSGSVFWPALLIAAGAVLLLTNMGYLPQISWDQLWRFWPVFLIAMGIDTLLSRRSAFGSFVGVLFILALLGGVVYLLVFAP